MVKKPLPAASHEGKHQVNGSANGNGALRTKNYPAARAPKSLSWTDLQSTQQRWLLTNAPKKDADTSVMRAVADDFLYQFPSFRNEVPENILYATLVRLMRDAAQRRRTTAVQQTNGKKKKNGFFPGIGAMKGILFADVPIVPIEKAAPSPK